MNTPEDVGQAQRRTAPGGGAKRPLTLIHTNKVPNPMGMRVSSVLPTLAEQVDLYEFKAAWCERNGFPVDALQHRAHIAQLRRAAHGAKSEP